MATLTSATPPSFPVPAARALAILVVDDMADLPPLIRDWLVRRGHLVHCAFSGHEAIALLRREHVDLVITDVLMPDGDGPDLIGQVRRLQPAARILAISGGGRYVESDDCLKIARGLGAHAALMKPFDRDKLFEGIAQARAEPRNA